jgi:hypothetical protein
LPTRSGPKGCVPKLAPYANEIRARLDAGESARSIGRDLSVCHATVLTAARHLRPDYVPPTRAVLRERTEEHTSTRPVGARAYGEGCRCPECRAYCASAMRVHRHKLARRARQRASEQRMMFRALRLPLSNDRLLASAVSAADAVF